MGIVFKARELEGGERKKGKKKKGFETRMHTQCSGSVYHLVGAWIRFFVDFAGKIG